MASDEVGRMARHTDALIRTAAQIDDVAAPSLCMGWSRGHVLSHVARNAEAIGRLCDWALTGVVRPMYPGGTAGRDADIEAGARRPLAAQLVDVTATATALADPIARVGTAAVVPLVELRGRLQLPPARLVGLRLREVVYHHVDLDAGFDFADVEDDLVAEFLADEVTRLGAHPKRPPVTVCTDTGLRSDVGGGGPEVTGTAAALLMWLARRDPRGVSGSPIPDLPRGG